MVLCDKLLPLQVTGAAVPLRLLKMRDLLGFSTMRHETAVARFSFPPLVIVL